MYSITNSGQFKDYVQLFAGYTFLSASNVVRAGSLIDLGVSPSPPHARHTR